MRVLQLIDSLNPGGAERMAVNIANALNNAGVDSFICTTREEGKLKSEIDEGVSYFYLKKLHTLDIAAILRIRRFIIANNIKYIHAHTTSYFFATLIKVLLPKIVIVWHEHHGNRIITTKRNNLSLYFCSMFFSHIIVVNSELEDWCRKYLRTANVCYLPNFVPQAKSRKLADKDKTIVCLANFRTPKNHQLLLEAYNIVYSRYPEWKLQLIGRDYKDLYSKELKVKIKDKGLINSIVFSTTEESISKQLLKASIGVLSSDSEGLPMAILEYGTANLAVICTNVGECKKVIGDYGKVVPPQNAEALANAILFYIENETIRQEHSNKFSKHIQENYSEAAIIPKLLEIYKTTAL